MNSSPLRPHQLRTLDQSRKLQNVLYDIRGPVTTLAEQMEADGHRIMMLNTGNPAKFGFDAPDTIVQDMVRALPHAQGYSESKGIYSARRAVVTRYEMDPDFPRFDVNDVWLGNGVSELITMTTQALLDAVSLRRHFGDVAGLRIAVVGDILHSRVARSNVAVLRRLGASVTLVAPPSLLPTGVETWGVDVTYGLDDVLGDVDAVMMLRVQAERMLSLIHI